ncbi:spore protease YyaC [Clostridium tetani]|uniref:spore protease YyaC n=1 Tax=Clostridium tetani TaxID=1513 RepID=UPI000D207F6C|nr:spore protease YyaC [Clostridium tetani]AVP55539.1 spore protease YyaC [Clostridium tetani]RXI53407.1 spore protease YyaC [Clostridium tetani]RXI56419.1 spore protease YyaC [Clostridium tetani]RXI77421.1 spore protease YyaC [Clostridium tetani]RXM71831.1 spore protease YyaC [Clostridium tetani]
MDKIMVHYNDPLAYKIMGETLSNFLNNNTIIVCVGTDKCIGDSLGPITGTILKEKNFPLPVFGTVENPIHALNIKVKMSEIASLYPNHNIIGIDACLGESNNIGFIQSRNYPIYPGKGVGKKLPHVGNHSIVGIVDSTEINIFNNNSIRLNFILNMAKSISHSIIYGFKLTCEKYILPNKNKAKT